MLRQWVIIQTQKCNTKYWFSLNEEKHSSRWDFLNLKDIHDFNFTKYSIIDNQEEIRSAEKLFENSKASIRKSINFVVQMKDLKEVELK